MNLFKKNENKSEENNLERKRSISYSVIFIAISFLIMSVLGIIFIVQMDLQPGWEFGELQGERPVELRIVQDSNSDRVLCYTDHQPYRVYEHSNSDPQWGGIFLLNSKTGNIIERRAFDGPIKFASQVMDIDEDGVQDYIISKATVGDEWLKESEDSDAYYADIAENQFKNKIVSGSDLTDISNQESFSSNWIIDTVSGENLIDGTPGIICLEKLNVSSGDHSDLYRFYLRTYYKNGTLIQSHTLNPEGGGSHESDHSLPKIELLNYSGTNHLFFANTTYFALYNLSTENFIENPIYNDFTSNIVNFKTISDLDSNDVGELALVNQTSNVTAQVSVLNGSTGEALHTVSVSFNFEFHNVRLTEIDNDMNEKTFVALDINGETGGNENYIYYRNTTVYKITQNEVDQEYTNLISGSDGMEGNSIAVLGNDLNQDGISEIIQFSKTSSGDTMETFQINLFDFINKKVITKLDINFYISQLQSISDFDDDGRRDMLILQDQVVTAVSSREPLPIFLSTAFPLGFPIFVVLIILLVISVILLLLYGRKFKFAVDPIKENIRMAMKKKKLTIGTIVISILLITLTFVMFLSLLNVMNNTLVAGTWMSDITIINLLVMILWYALLPLTAAIYNIFAPYFAYFFIRLRDLFFRISKAYDDRIIVLDMKGREELGLISKLKRIIVPLSLSLAVGFYIYNTVAPLMGYRTSFTNISGEALGRFMGGYMLLCILPLIFSFLIFSFFNAGNYLLDDSGVVYLRVPKNYRKPADVEPISYWTQSIVKGFAGLSALITFFQFVLALDITTVIDMTGMGAFFLAFLLIIIFYALPFLTGFSYILLAEELMDFSTSYNRKRLYHLMEKKYDTSQREIKIPETRSKNANGS